MSVLIAGSLTMTVVLIAGCKSDDGPNLEGFLREAERLDRAHEASATPLRETLGTLMGALQPKDLVTPDLKQTLATLFEQEEKLAGEIEKIETPDEATGVRDEAVNSLRTEAEFGRKLAAGITPTTTFEELTGLFESEEAVQLESRRTNACAGLQDLADKSGIAVDMSC